MEQKTTRQRIEELLRERPSIGPSGLRDALSDYKISLTPDEIIEEVKELHKSLDEPIHVQPARCKGCKYDDFDNLINIPSSCPECNSEWIKEPQFSIEG